MQEYGTYLSNKTMAHLNKIKTLVNSFIKKKYEIENNCSTIY